MRRYKKKELLDIVNTLIEANDYAKKSGCKNEEIMVDILAQCQETALSIGNDIETYGEIGEPLVKVLEEYCEDIYQLSINMAYEEARSKLIKRIHRQLVLLKNSIYEKLPQDKKEIVFLPYKASMWDSMESVWRAASNDATYQVYVIPIPYFEKKADGTFGQMHYEGEQYPKYVPITSWEEYSLAENKPDIIYIHNPYDNYNRVTSVHPQFYSSELKKCTQMLVYIPYFVGIDDIVEEHFCTLPGTLFADKVIVQSEKVREIYIEQIRKFEELNNLKGKLGDIEKKVVALGSPKLDSFSSYNEENNKEEVPTEWRRLLINEDGTRKKCVLYNTTIDAILKKNEKMLKKIETVLDTFEREKNIVLLWRPHPLLKSTLQSMRPSLLEKYKEIEDKYKNAGWGILDESSQLHRAIEVSDYYYGDGSSVVELYKNTGKPLWIQDAEYLGVGTEKFYCFFIGMCIYKDSIYGVQVDRNLILRMDIKDGKIHPVREIPGVNMRARQSYHYLKSSNEKIYFIPFRESELMIYDIKADTFSAISLDLKKELKNQDRGNFYNCHLYKNKIFLIPFGYKAIVSYDFKTGVFEHCVDFTETVLKDEDILFHVYDYIDETHLIFSCFCSNRVVIFNLENYQYEILEVGDSSYRYSAIKRYKDDFWLVVKNKLAIIKWNYITGKITEYKDFPDGITLANDKHCFDAQGIIIHENNMYCFPAACNMAIKINLENGSISEISALEPYCKNEGLQKDISTFAGCVVKDGIVYLHYQKESIVAYNLVTEEVWGYKREICNEESDWRAMGRAFIHCLCEGNVKMDTEGEKSMQRLNKENSGSNIHKFICSQ